MDTSTTAAAAGISGGSKKERGKTAAATSKTFPRKSSSVRSTKTTTTTAGKLEEREVSFGLDDAATRAPYSEEEFPPPKRPEEITLALFIGARFPPLAFMLCPFPLPSGFTGGFGARTFRP